MARKSIIDVTHSASFDEIASSTRNLTRKQLDDFCRATKSSPEEATNSLVRGLLRELPPQDFIDLRIATIRGLALLDQKRGKCNLCGKQTKHIRCGRCRAEAGEV